MQENDRRHMLSLVVLALFGLLAVGSCDTDNDTSSGPIHVGVSPPKADSPYDFPEYVKRDCTGETMDGKKEKFKQGERVYAIREFGYDKVIISRCEGCDRFIIPADAIW